MKKLLIIALVFVSLTSFVYLPAAASAVRPSTPGGGGSPKPTTTVEMKGYDVSYPQCGRSLPTDHYFAIVGVNGGTAASENPCLAQQLVWANTAKSGLEGRQDKVQLYVNTGNPAQETIYNWETWPTQGYTPYGACEGERNNSLACSWLYGWNRSVATEAYFLSQVPVGMSKNTSDYMWWLDVETMNSWQAGSDEALARNRASLEGFAAYYRSKNAQIGLYSTEYQWDEIVGKTLITDGNLVGLPNWRPSGSNLANAKKNCTLAPLTSGGFISLTQYVVKNLDNNHSCI